jgi:hypothetical protein
MESTTLPDALQFRLYVARQLLNSGFEGSEHEPPTGRMTSLILLDQSVELLLRSLLSHIGIPLGREAKFDDLLKRLWERFPSLSSHHRAMQAMRNQRNQVQHDGMVPSPEDVRRIRTEVEVFFREALLEVTGLELEAVSPGNLLSEKALRDHYLSAELAFRENDFVHTITRCANALALGRQLINQRRHESPGRDIARSITDAISAAAGRAGASATHSTRFAPSNSEVASFASEFSRNLGSSWELQRALRELAEPIELTALGINGQSYAKFRSFPISNRQSINDSEPRYEVDFDGWQPSSSDAAFALGFTLESMLALQRLGWTE